MMYLSLSAEKTFYSQNIKEIFLKGRRDIVDRNGTILATDVNLYDAGIRPKLLKDKEKKNLLIKLSLLLPDLDTEIINLNQAKDLLDQKILIEANDLDNELKNLNQAKDFLHQKTILLNNRINTNKIILGYKKTDSKIQIDETNFYWQTFIFID